ncbi:SpvB/TcaC N-terminal domain-containing protein [Aliiglaciecola sp. CAU 1673]|uniref:RHS repeat-associated core domain-containing protein n=1 Tax=Aliiglaciecola sp. CAU 1673 TaxID=3032595 RepID=UPI0023DCB1BC|nr:RHS repeat-associated core domain-containing protein [Aliiglaciecola sp. CAU 1673]MDF2176845.1 SpvB/TcaC N-terminal domain-containing protein [Aliiglaciecola sp. CAU 1673]
MRSVEKSRKTISNGQGARRVSSNGLRGALFTLLAAMQGSALAMQNTVTLTWGEVEGAQQYRLEERVKDATAWPQAGESIRTTSETRIEISKETGEFEYRVIGCVINPAQPDTPLCDEVAEYSNTLAVDFDAADLPAEVEIPSVPVVASAPTLTDNNIETGAIEGNLVVDTSGGATWSTDLFVPAGIGGFQPQVSISYSSLSGNGTLGVGWSFSAGSEIRRCRQYFEQDGQYREIQFNNEDELCLDGQRLIPVTTAHFTNYAEYRPQFDPSTKVLYLSAGGGQFEVHRASGETWYYGATTDSVSKDVASNEVYSWLLSQKQDTSGNTIDYVYAGSDTNQRLLDEINYSGNKVDFVYATRTDSAKHYFQGNGIISDKILDNIVIYNHNNLAINSYHFAHEQSAVSNRSLLKSITRCNGSESGYCLQPTTFEYEEDIQLGLAQNKLVIPLSDFMATEGERSSKFCDGHVSIGDYYYCLGKDLKLIDSDGDGIQEVFVVNSVGTKYYYQNLHITADGYQLGTVHGNADLVAWNFSVGDGYSQTGYSIQSLINDKNGDGIDEVEFVHNFPSSGLSRATPNLYADLTGDGLVELAGEPSNAAIDDAFDRCPFESVKECNYDSTTFDFEISGSVVDVFDFNGDGLVDRFYNLEGFLVDIYDERPNSIGEVYYLLKNTTIGSTFSEEPIFLGELGDYGLGLKGDFNGDGYLDFSEVGCTTGKGFVSCLPEHVDAPLQNTRLRSVVDANNDGLDDFIYLNDADGRFKAKTSSYNAANRQLLDFGSKGADVTDVPFSSGKYLWVDLDGDGLPALVYFDTGTSSLHIYHDANLDNKPTDLLRSVNNGMGLSASFEYESLVHSDHYSKYADAHTLNWGSSPVFDSKGSLYVVTEFTQATAVDTNGSVLSKTLQYEYEGLRYQAGGRGSLGFAKITETDLSTYQRTVTSYRQDFPYTGKISQQQKQALNGNSEYVTLYEMTVTDWAHPSFLNDKVRQVEPKSVNEQRYTLNGANGDLGSIRTAMNTAVTTRDWLNKADHYAVLDSLSITKTDHRSGDVLQESTDYAYEQEDTSTWRIQRPTSVATTRTLTYADATSDTKSQTKTITYNSSGQVGSETLGAAGNEAEYLKTEYGYDGVGNLIRTTQCSNHFAGDCGTRVVPSVTELQTNKYKVFRRNINNFDTEGRFLSSTTNGLFTIATFSDYNALGLPGTVTDANGLAQYHYYDAFGRKYFTAAEDGSYSQTLLDDCSTGCPANATYSVTVSTPNAPDSRSYFDILGREVAKRTQMLTGNWSQVDSEYNEHGQLVAQTKPYLVTPGFTHTSRLYYDALGRKWKESAADGTEKYLSWEGYAESERVVSTYISSAGSRVSTANIDQTNEKTLNGFGQVVVSEDANSQRTTYQYGALGTLVKATNLDTSVVTVAYDNYGRKTSMTDPDKGYLIYRYNALGEMVERVAPGNVSQVTYYDAAGRTTKVKSGSSHQGQFIYVGALLESETSTDSSDTLTRAYRYDGWGRINGTTHSVGDKEWLTSTTYDQYGRVFQQFDASGDSRGTQYDYQYGYAKGLKEARNPERVYFQANGMDAFGNITFWELGNGHSGQAAYDPLTGFIQSIFSSSGSVALQDQLYEYDGLGNLRARTDKSGDLASSQLQEIFAYDELNRLTSVNFNGLNTLAVDYYDNGNIRSKSDVGNNGDYGYGTKPSQCQVTPGTHALSSIGSTHKYCYDNRGNQTHTYLNGALSREVTYTAYDKPSRIWSAKAETRFNYDAKFSRYKRVDNDTDGKTSTTYYIEDNEVVIHEDGLTEYKRYIGESVLDVVRSNGNNQTHYLHRDHIGSVVAIADENGDLVARMSYDAFGKRREGSSWNALQSAFAQPSIKAALDITERGFTGHEHVDHADIIHMNGRIYDSVTGRFVQADPIVQAPENGQSLNRYSYVFNNPLSYTDPTGYVAVCKQADPRGGPTRCTESDNEQKDSAEQGMQSRQESLSPGETSKIRGNANSQNGQVSDGAFDTNGKNGSNNPEKDKGWGFWDTVQTGLTAIGFVPVVGELADLANVGISLARGDMEGAALSAAAMVPFVGNAAGMARMGKAAERLADSSKVTKRGPLPNGGNAKPHGNANHNSAIDNRVGELKQDPSVSNIRKNQQQVDVNGNKVGTNRPDIQYDQGGCHHCVEYDHVPRNSTRHGDQIRANDPNAKVELNLL